ncbi:pro-neuregulin-1, membrane-bound isoform isoform X4 [Polypterus senegalus]|uniref:pro-neuregulin-1, membrane-bound isoform isoform X4 n=1 Tax=Polypterus senegalus TaxID=55291 RepID=UPI001966CBD5|nr:pro-neuregulin-1, membrane-bound isoform isoform X4 [Polypterus senegalus]
MSDIKKPKGQGRKKGNKKAGKETSEPVATEGSSDPVPPKLKKIKNVKIVEGRKAVLKCEASVGKPKFAWYKDGKQLDEKVRNMKIKERQNKMASEIQIRKVTASHHGEYICEAFNQHGKDRATVRLDIITASTTPPIGTGHFIGCSEKEKNYCVNGGECLMLNDVPSKIKYLCRCPNEFTGDRCQNYVMASFYKHLGIEFMEAEELYQKRILTIAGICIALLVVGIMCVVAYCKTKKQRKKLHDRLRQSLRYERNNTNSLANGPHHPNPTTEHVQLAHQYASKSAVDTHNILEKEMETSFSTSQYTSTTHHSTTVKSASVHSWSNCQTESIITESRSVLVTSSVETSRQTSPFGHRSRLNGTGCLRDVNVFLKNSRDTPESFKDSPYSERYMSAVTTPNRLSPVDLQPPVGPSLPPSEMSPSVSSLATSMPSVAISPFMEEERPLLLVTPPQLREKWHDYSNSNQQRNSAHYNEGHEAHSPPPSPLRIVEDDEYETTQEYEAPAQQPVKKVSNSRRAKRTKINGHGQHKVESDSDSISVSNSSESETEDERIGEDTPFLSIQNPMTTNLDSAPTFWLAEGSRTNTSQKLSAQDELQARLSGVISNQDPIAV